MVRQYLATYDSARASDNRTFGKRPVWYACDDNLDPDAFLPCMVSDGVHLLLNEAASTCTNTIHRIYFLNDASPSFRQLVAISMLSTFTQLSAEIEGRCYGSGGLKLEPSDVLRLRLLLPGSTQPELIQKAFIQVDEYLRAGKRGLAREYADAFVLSDYSAADARQSLSRLNAALTEARSRRQR
jgi:hypothetical protein